MQLRRKCGTCHGYGYLYASSSPEARRVTCEVCHGEGDIEIDACSLCGERVRITATGIEGECNVLFHQLIVLDDDDHEHIVAMEDIELCVPS